MDQIKVGKFISTNRKLKHMTQRELADILGISDKTISKRERGRGMPDVSLLQPLCDALGISLNELFLENIYRQRNIKERRKKIFPNFTKKSKLPILNQ
mgnify:CR=1 FL=1